jgi:uncharacterized protein
MAEPTRVDLSRVAQDLQLRRVQVEAVIALLDEGNTIPFITRYRKERTGGLDEDTIRRVQERVGMLRVLADRKSTVLRSIEAQGKLTEELRQAIEAAESFKRLEDLYLPFKPKKRSLATVARERGLEPLARAVWQDDESAKDLAAAAQLLVDPTKELNTPDEVIAGVGHIIAEDLAENVTARSALRRVIWQTGKIVSKKVDNLSEERGKSFRDYFDFSEPLEKVPAHRVLALNRGESEEVLKLQVDVNGDAARQAVFSALPAASHTHSDRLREWAGDALTRLLQPALEREVRRELTDEAEEHAVQVFARNLRWLLLQSPIGGKRVLAIDPGFRTGCKLATIDETGKLLAQDVIHPHPPLSRRAEAKEKLLALIQEHNIFVVAIGNGTACRETEELIAELINEAMPNLAYTIVNECGASVYSTSAVGREEFPDQDATVRGTISIGRRLQDPLSELVKIEPQHIGVGLYQHDVHPRQLKDSLAAVVESCVNYVGVNLNTASVPLLRHVAGLNQLTARRLVEWRQSHGAFAQREQMKEVQGIGDVVFTQAAGFLKIPGGANPLDSTWIHPESYGVAQKLLEKMGFAPESLRNAEEVAKLGEKLTGISIDALAQELNAGSATMRDIIEALQRPGRDPRDDLPPPLFKKGILKLEDLTPGTELRGKVLNVVDFGVFVDIGLKESGLVHISQLSPKFIRSPHDVVTVGQVVTAWVLSVDTERSRVSLTMIAPGTPRRQQTKPPPKKAVATAEQGPRPPRPAPKTDGAAASPGTGPAPSPTATPPAPAPMARKTPTPPPPHTRKPRPQVPPKPLSKAVLDGKEPARSFGELKRLWDAKRKE